MKKRSLIATTFLGLALSFGFISCSEDEDQPALEYQKQGFIEGEITGVSQDGSYVFEDDFEYEQYSALTGGVSTYTQDGDSYNVTLVRSDFEDYGTAEISFYLSNAEDVTPEDIRIEFEYSKELRDRFVTFEMDSDDGENSVTITNFTFDSATGKAKGDFTLTGTSNSTGKNALISGSFNVIAKEEVQ